MDGTKKGNESRQKEKETAMGLCESVRMHQQESIIFPLGSQSRDLHIVIQ
jgi:hypothetical protein